MATEVKHSGGIHFKKAKCMGKTDDNGEIECTTTAAMVIVNGDAYVLKYLHIIYRPLTRMLIRLPYISQQEFFMRTWIVKLKQRKVLNMKV